MNLGQPIIKMDDDEFHNNNNTTTIPPPLLAMLLKNHPLLHNVKSTSTSKTVLPVDEEEEEGSYNNNLASSSSSIDSVVVLLKATQPIFKGQELFLDPSDVYYYYRNPNIPTLDDYKEADTLIKEERVVFKVSDSKKRTAHYKKRIPEIGIGLRMTQKAVSKYSPRVASLLPIMADQLLDYNFGLFPGKESLSAILSLNNYTYDYLTEYGVCISDVEFITTTSSKSNSNNNNKNDDETSVTIIQNGLNRIPKGKRIVPVPLYVTTTKTALKSDNSFGFTNNCLYHQSSIMVICPMIPLEYNIIVVSSSGGGDGDDDDDTVDVDDDAKKANAKLQWSIWNPIDATIKEPDVVLEKYSTELTWDAIATKDLIPGEKIVVSVEKDPSTGMLLVPNELFPEKWIRNSINNNDDVEASKSSNNCVDDNCNSNDQHMEGDVEQRVEL